MADMYQPSTRVISRRAKVEQSKLLQQTLIFGGLGILFLVVGVFVIIPWFIRTMGGSATPTTVTADDGVPLQPPRLDAPLTATFSAEIKLRGVSEKGNEVRVLNNDKQVGSQMVSDDGNFEIVVPLDKGDNVLSAVAVNADKKESNPSAAYTVVMDNEPPKLEITEPTDQQVVQGKKNQNMTIKGTTDQKTKLYLNDRLIFAHEDGTFSTVHRLENGDNVIVLKAIDQAGNQTEKTVTVKFSE